jgi:HD-like signal output (HDOD) protein
MPFTHAMKNPTLRVADPDPQAAAAEAAVASLSAQAFEFVQKLAAELSTGRVDLPAFPEVAIRVHRVLAVPDVTDERIARVISSDAGLAARMLAMANSAALSRGGRAIVDLRQAVTRVGHQHVRSAAIAYAMGQIRMAETLSHIREDLHALWQASTLAAALAHVVAVHTKAANADEALLAGLMHNIGSVYILARAERHSALFHDPAVRDAIMTDWNAHIGRSIAENWCMSDDIAEAIAEQAVDQRPPSGRRDLLDVLSVAVRTAGFRPGVSDPALVVAGANTFARLGIDASMLEQLLAESAGEVEELRSALGD